MLKGIIGMAVGAFVLIATIPAVIEAFNAVNSTGFTTMQLALWPLVGLIIIVGAIYSLADESGLI
jgi:hypothetical protein